MGVKKKDSKSKTNNSPLQAIHKNKNIMKWIKPAGIILGIFLVTWGIAYLLYTNVRPIRLAFATNVGGIINVDTTWKADDNPFIVTSDITITNGAVLTLEPGVQVYAESPYGIAVTNGSISAIGTAEQGISFNTEALLLIEAPGQWGSILIDGIGNSGVFKYVTFKNGGGTGQATLRNRGGELSVDHCVFDYNYISVSTSGSATTSITNSSFENYILPVAITPEATVTLGDGNVLGGSVLENSYTGISLVESLDTNAYLVEKCDDSICLISQRDIGVTRNVPYVIPRNLAGDPVNLVFGDVLPGGDLVDISSGVIIKMDGGGIRLGNAIMDAGGAYANPVVFTSVKDDTVGGDTNNDASVTTPAKQDWGSITIYPNTLIDDSFFEYTVFKYAGDGALKLDGEPANIVNCSFIDNYGGIVALKADDTWMDDKLLTTNFTGNTVAFSSTALFWVEAPDNWWGAQDGPYDEQAPIGHCTDGDCNNGSGDKVLDYLVYAPYSSSAWNVPTAPGYVNDGSGEDIDAINSTTNLSGNWGAVINTEYYEYCIGTTQTACDTLSWTDNGTSTAFSISSLALLGGETYYIQVRSWNLFGPGTAAASDGFVVDIVRPEDPFEIDQLTFNKLSSIEYGETISDNRVWFRFAMKDTGGSTFVYPQIELREIGVPFSNVFTSEGERKGAVEFEDYSIGEVLMTGLESGKSYHWQARVRDDAGNYSNWVTFVSQVSPIIAETYDFRVNVPNRMLIVAPGEIFTSGTGISGTPIRQIAGVNTDSFRLYIVDGNNRIISDYTTTVLLSSNDPYPAQFSSNNIQVSRGVGSFTMTFYTSSSGGWRVTAKDNQTVFADARSSLIPVRAGGVSSGSTVDIIPARVYADGVAQARILIRLVDSYNNPIVGYTPTVTSSGVSGRDYTLVPPTATDTNGETSAYISSAVVGIRYVSVDYGLSTRAYTQYPVDFHNTAVAPEEVRDGLDGDSDYQLSRDTISGNWDGVEDFYLAGYEFAITTDANTENVFAWKDVSSELFYTVTDLSLVLGETYYVKLRTYNTLGVRSSAVVSDGIEIIEENMAVPGDCSDCEPIEYEGIADLFGPNVAKFIANIAAASQFISDGGLAIPTVNTAVGIAAIGLPVLISGLGVGFAEGFGMIAQQGVFWQTIFGAPFGFVRYSKRKKLPWNTVYDSITKKPLAFAVIRLLSQSDEVKHTTVADELGRFTYLSPAFDYKMEAAMSGYVFPSSSVTGAQDDPFGKVYRGEILSAGAGASGLALPLDKMKLATKRPLHVNILGIIGQTLFFGGFVWSIYCVLNAPRWYNILVLAVYSAIVMHIVFSSIKKARSFGVIEDASGAKPIKGVTIQLINQVTNQIIDRRLTDDTGRYQFFANEGEYILKAIHPAFKPVQQKLEIGEKGKLINVNFKLDKIKRKTKDKEEPEPKAKKAGSKSKLVSSN